MNNRLKFGRFILFLMLSCPLYARGEMPAGVAADTPTLHVDQRSEAVDKSVYRIRPWIDGPVLGIAAAGSLVPLLYESTLVHQNNPGNPHDVNSIDRTVIGNHNPTVATLSDVTVGLAITVPIVLDVREVGWTKPLAEDFVVYAEVL